VPRLGGLVCRYTDLLCHYQIKAALLNKEVPLTAACLERASKRFDDVVRRHRSIENECINHFLAMYCERQPERVYTGEVLGVNKDGNAVLQLIELGLERTLTLSKATFPGRKVSLRAVPDRIAGTVTWQEA
jgi:exoribonuclease R